MIHYGHNSNHQALKFYLLEILLIYPTNGDLGLDPLDHSLRAVRLGGGGGGWRIRPVPCRAVVFVPNKGRPSMEVDKD